jgi:DNA-binding CsgD family transcriptional regulator
MTRDIWTKCQIREKSTTFPRKCWGGIWGESLEKKITILRNKGLNLPKKHINIDNALVVPLLVDTELVGQIALANKDDGFTAMDQHQLESIAEFLAPILKIYLEKEEMDKELRSSVLKLKQTNIALNVMIDNRKDEKRDLSCTIQENFDKLVFPYHDTIKKSHSKEEILTILEIIKQNTRTCLLSLDTPGFPRHPKFSPKESQVAHFIKAGKTSKEIASILHISIRSVFFHRNNIRKKLNIDKTKTNLKTFLAHFNLH